MLVLKVIKDNKDKEDDIFD